MKPTVDTKLMSNDELVDKRFIDKNTKLIVKVTKVANGRVYFAFDSGKTGYRDRSNFDQHFDLLTKVG